MYICMYVCMYVDTGCVSMFEGTETTENAHGAGCGPIQVCRHRHHQIYWQGQTHLDKEIKLNLPQRDTYFIKHHYNKQFLHHIQSSL